MKETAEGASRRKEEGEEWERKSKERCKHIEQTMKETAERASRRKEEGEEWERKSEERCKHIEQTLAEAAEEKKRTDQALQELAEQDKRTEQTVEQLTKRFDHLEEKMVGEFRQLRRDVTQQMGQLGGRWGIQNESVWRQTIATLIEGTYGDTVEEVWIEGDQFDVVITNGDHILLEITARFKTNDVAKVIRKRNLYTRHYQAPTPFIVAAAAIHYGQASALMNEGFELIEPEVE
jgi:hypothetical protein